MRRLTRAIALLSIGGLRAFKGSPRYPIPEGVNRADYASVVIWCERFPVLVSPADLVPATAAPAA